MHAGALMYSHTVSTPVASPKSALTRRLFTSTRGIVMNRFVLAIAAAGLGATLLPSTAWAEVSAPEAQVDALEGVAGKQPRSRRSQAKGVCASGYFVGNAAGRELSSASVFSGEKVPLVARFSVAGGNPKASDHGIPASVGFFPVRPDANFCQ